MDTIDMIAEKGSITTLEKLHKAYEAQINEVAINLSSVMEQIKTLTATLITNMEIYEKQTAGISLKAGASREAVVDKYKLLKKLIYTDFFNLQNLINGLMYQKIFMTYVHEDPITGNREIKIYENDVEHLVTTHSSYYGREIIKLTYTMDSHMETLKNSLNDDENIGLQNTAQEVTRRYRRYNKKILWQINDEWKGYKLNNLGPINEAFTAFYLHEIKLDNTLMENIDQFMLSEQPQGVIYADNANGFLIGDLSIGGMQFAIKGDFASPQGYKQVIKALKLLQASGFNMDGFSVFRKTLIDIEKEKAKSLVQPLTQRSLNATIRYHKDALLKETQLTNKDLSQAKFDIIQIF